MSSAGSSPIVFLPPPSPPPTPAHPEASLSTQERLRLAKRRRAAQLKRWTQREREKNHPDVVRPASGETAGAGGSKKRKKVRRGIEFVPNVMLLEAAARNDVEEVRRLLELGVSPDSTNEDGLTALHQCCIDDSAEMMKILVEYGANPNATDTEKWTPLHAAATCGHLHLVKFLIDHSADLLAVNADGNMPYDLCEDDTTLSYIENEMAKRGVTQELIDDTRSSTERRMIRDLKAAPSDMLEFRDKQGATPLHIAAANGYLSVVEYLLDNHVTTDSVDLDLWQPIHAAACWGHLEVVEMLAQNGANISAKTKNGETPFDICEDPEIKERLIQLKEQRVRQDGPKVRRSRSASTRTQSIRRTSLREKMNVTKKDVQEEKLYYIHTFDAASAGGDTNGKSYGNSSPESPDSKPVVDINDVELTILPGFSARSLEEKRSSNNFDKHIQPMLPPKRPPRTGTSPISSSSVHGPSNSSSNSNAISADKINIHVSVTINAPPNSASQGGSPALGYLARSAANADPGGLGSPGGTTLADLKKARSMSRSIVSSSASPAAATMAPCQNSHPSPFYPPDLKSSPSPPPSPPASGSNHRTTSDSPTKQRRKPPAREPSSDSSVDMHMGSDGFSSGNNGIQKFSASTNEVVGPTQKKEGCCVII